MGIGVIEPRSHSLAVVSLRSAWRSGQDEPADRARWRLDAYGSDVAATEMDRLLDDWTALQRRDQTTLGVTATPRAGHATLSFAWGSTDSR